MTAPAVAIDFGTTRTKVAYYDGRQPRLVELGRETRAIVPSIFYIPQEGGRLVGDDAQDMLDTDPEGIIIGLKKEIHKLGKKRLGPGRPSVDRVELASDLFAFIRTGCCNEVFHAEVVECVLTVPVAFEEQKRERIRQAAELAGFRKISIAEEPVAAAKYWLATSGQHIADTVVVCDVGGGTTDLALLRHLDGQFAPVPDVPPTGFSNGGNDVDESIWDCVMQNHEAANAAESCRSAFLAKLRRVKELLTRDRRELIPLMLGTTKVTIPRTIIEEGIHEFVEQVAEETQRFLDRCQTMAGVKDSPILLIGGASRLPGLKEALEKLAPGRVLQWNQSDYATVLGAVEWPVSAPTNVQVLVAKPVPVPSEQKPPKPPLTPDSSPEPSEPSPESQALLARAEQLLEQANQYRSDPSEEKQALREQCLATAMEHVQAACDLEPNRPDAFFAKSRVLMAKEEWSLAAAALTVCLRLNPDHPDVWGMRGTCKFRCADFSGARKDLDEEIRRRPTVVCYRLRAAAFVRTGDAAAAVNDIQSALASSDADTPRAALLFIAGFLLHKYLEHPHDAIPLYGQALSQIRPPSTIYGARILSETAVDSQAFTQTCQLFDIVDSMIYVSHRDMPAERLVNPVASIQRHLWSAVAAIHGPCHRSSVEMFVSHNGQRDVEDREIWEDSPEFCRHQASIWACDEKTDGVTLWLERLWDQQPDYDVNVIKSDPGFKGASSSGGGFLIEPKWSYTEQHGMFFNKLTITNMSPFRMTDIHVKVSISRTSGPGELVHKKVGRLSPGASKSWDGVFPDGGFLGGKIRSVNVSLECAEGEARRVRVSSQGTCTTTVKKRTTTFKKPCVSFPASSTAMGIRIACPHCGKTQTIASSNVEKSLNCLSCGKTYDATVRTSQGVVPTRVNEYEAACTNCGRASHTMLSTGKCPYCK